MLEEYDTLAAETACKEDKDCAGFEGWSEACGADRFADLEVVSVLASRCRYAWIEKL